MRSLMVLGVVGLVASLGACGSGSAGPQGAQGEPGEAGAPGMPGAPGEAGPPGAGFDGAVPSSISGVTPEKTFLARTTDVTISGYGTSWSSTTKVDFGAGIKVNKVTVASPTALVVNITTDKAAATGPRDIKVTDGSNADTYKGAFTVISPLSFSLQGNVAQGGNVIGTIRTLDLQTPFDSTTDPNTLAYTNFVATAGPGVTVTVQSVTDYAASVEITFDVMTPAGAQDLDIVSGPPGVAAQDVDFPAPKSLNVAAVTPTALAGAAVNGSAAAAYDTSVFSFTPASASQTILDFSISTTSSTFSPAFLLLGSDGKWSSFITGARPSAGAAGTFSYVSTQTTPFYGITWDNSGAFGPFTIGPVVSTAAASTAAATATDGTTGGAIPATTFPFVLTGGDLTHNSGGGDWVKVTMPSGKTSLRVQSSGDLNTGTAVAVTLNGSTPAGTTTSTTDTGSIVDATFTGLVSGLTYYVTFTPSQLGGTTTDFTGIIRAL